MARCVALPPRGGCSSFPGLVLTLLTIAICGSLVTLPELALAQWSFSDCPELTAMGMGSGAGDSALGAGTVAEVANAANFSLSAPCTIRGFFILRIHFAKMQPFAAAAGRTAVRAALRGVRFESITNLTFPTVEVVLSNTTAPLGTPFLPVDFALEQSSWNIPILANTLSTSFYGVILKSVSRIPVNSSIALRSVNMVVGAFENTQTSTTFYLTLLSAPDTDYPTTLIGASTLSLTDAHVQVRSLTGSGVLNLHTAYFYGIDATNASVVAIRDSSVSLFDASLSPIVTARKVTQRLVYTLSRLTLSAASTMLFENSSALIADGIDRSTRGIFYSGILFTAGSGPELYDASLLLFDRCRVVLRNATFDTFYPSIGFFWSTKLYGGSVARLRQCSVETLDVVGTHTYTLLLEAGNNVRVESGSTLAIERSNITTRGVSIPNGGFLRGLWGRNWEVRGENTKVILQDVSVVLGRWNVSVNTGSVTVTLISYGSLLLEDRAETAIRRSVATVEDLTDTSTSSGRSVDVAGFHFDFKEVIVRNGARMALEDVAIGASQFQTIRGVTVYGLYSQGMKITLSNRSTLTVADVRVSATDIFSSGTSSFTSAVVVVGGSIPELTVKEQSKITIERCAATGRAMTVPGVLDVHHLGSAALLVDVNSSVRVANGRLSLTSSTFGRPAGSGRDGGAIAMTYTIGAATVRNNSLVSIVASSAELRRIQQRSNIFYGLFVLRVDGSVTMDIGASEGNLYGNCAMIEDITTPAWTVGASKVAPYQTGITTNVNVCSGTCRLASGRMCLTRTASVSLAPPKTRTATPTPPIPPTTTTPTTTTTTTTTTPATTSTTSATTTAGGGGDGSATTTDAVTTTDVSGSTTNTDTSATATNNVSESGTNTSMTTNTPMATTTRTTTGGGGGFNNVALAGTGAVSGSGGLAAAVIVAIVMGIIALLTAIGVVLVCRWWHRREALRRHSFDMHENDEDRDASHSKQHSTSASAGKGSSSPRPPTSADPHYPDYDYENDNANAYTAGTGGGDVNGPSPSYAHHHQQEGEGDYDYEHPQDPHYYHDEASYVVGGQEGHNTAEQVPAPMVVPQPHYNYNY